MATGHAGRLSLALERSCWAAGLVALGLWATAVASGTLAARRGLEQFATRKAALAMPERPPDQRLWSPERVRAWRESLSVDATAPLAVLRIPRLELEVPVLSGTADWTLNRAVGHIDGTARPGAAGNSGIAGHRDGFFRGLKDVQPGDVVEIETLAGVSPYRVDRIWIVGPDDVSVLDPTPTGAVTLVTCYPFYFVGSAPQRFIVRAVRIDAPQRASARTPE